MVKQFVFGGTQTEILKLIKYMGEFETLGNFFKFQNEIMEGKC